MSLPEHLRDWWSNGQGDPDRMPFGAALDEIQRKAGSGRKAAAALGIPETTWRRLKRGVTPKTQTRYRDRLSGELRRLFMPAAPKGFKDKLTAQIYNPRKRHAETRRFAILPGQLGRAQDRYTGGDLGAAAKAFRAGVTDPWYRALMDSEPGDDSEPFLIGIGW